MIRNLISMGIVKKKERERMAHIITKDIWHRIVEISERSANHNLNPAYELAFQIGLQGDIADSLRKLKQDSEKS